MNKNDNIPDFSEMSEEVPHEKSSWGTTNTIILILGFFSSIVLLMGLIATGGITAPMICIDILLNIFLAFFHIKWRKKRKYRKTVIALRISAIAAIIFTYSTPFIATNSYLKYVKPMYHVKKFIYCHGVYTGGMGEYLPSKLPKVCEDYKFVTEVGMIAQDYHPSAYLIFRTDTATMHKLEEDYKQVDGAKLVEINIDGEEYKREYGDNYMENSPIYIFPAHVYGQLDDEHIDDFFDAVIYKVPSYYGKGCVFDYDSGLVVYWT